MLNNRLVGLSLGSIPVSRLAEPLEITFSHQHLPPVSSLARAWQLLWGKQAGGPPQAYGQTGIGLCTSQPFTSTCGSH